MSKIPLPGPSGLPVKVIIKGVDGRDAQARDLAPEIQGRIDRFVQASRMNNAMLPGASAILRLPEGELRYTKNFWAETVTMTLATPEPEPAPPPPPPEPVPGVPWDWVIIELVVRNLSGLRFAEDPYGFQALALRVRPGVPPPPILQPVDPNTDDPVTPIDDQFSGSFDDGRDPPFLAFYEAIEWTQEDVAPTGIAVASLRIDLREVFGPRYSAAVQLHGRLVGGVALRPPNFEIFESIEAERPVEVWWAAGEGPPPDTTMLRRAGGEVRDPGNPNQFGIPDDEKRAYRSYRQWLQLGDGPPAFFPTEKFNILDFDVVAKNQVFNFVGSDTPEGELVLIEIDRVARSIRAVEPVPFPPSGPSDPSGPLVVIP